MANQNLVEQVVKGFTSSWNYVSSSYHKVWDDKRKLYKSERIQVGYNGISDTFVPMSYSIIETLTAATSGEKPLIEYVPTKPEQETNTDVLNGLFSYYWDIDSWTPKLIQHTRNLFLVGSSVLYLYWDIDHPVLRIIPLRDFYCDPTATIFSYDEASYMGYRFLANKEELKKEQIVDPETGELVPKYKNLDKLGETYDSGEMTDKQDQDIYMGSTLDKTAQKNQVEVLCHWTKDQVVYVGNRSEVLYVAPNDFKQRQQFLGHENPTGIYPFIVDVNLPSESQLYGTSALEAIAKPQELLNDMTNQNIDAVSWALDPTMELDPQYQSYLEKIKNVTGAVYPFKPGSYVAVQKPMVPSNAFNERSNIKNEIREATAIDEVIKGIGNKGDITATEIKAQVASAGRRFNLILSQLESGGYYKLAKLVFQLVQHYVTTPTMFRVIGAKGTDWETFDPEQFKGDYEPRVKLQATLEQEKREKMRDLKEMYSAFIGNPFVEQKALTRLIIQKAFSLEPDEAEALLATQQPGEEGGGAVDPNAKQEKPPQELINYKDAPPDIKAQMEQAAGMEPSVTHEGDMEALAAGSFSEQVKSSQTAMPLPDAPPGVEPTVPPQPKMGEPVGG